MDLPESFVIRESGSRILNPLDPAKLDQLGRSLRLPPGSRLLDLACGKGEALCTWARDLGFTGTGVDISRAFLADAEARAEELGVAEAVRFVHGDAAEHVAEEPVEVVSCLGASWIGGGESWETHVSGTVALMRRSLAPGGMLLLGEPWWRRVPETREALDGCYASSVESYAELPALLDLLDHEGLDVVGATVADPDSWDRYAAPQWLSVRRWLDRHPHHPLADEMREDLSVAPRRHLLHQREHLGWGVFTLIPR